MSKKKSDHQRVLEHPDPWATAASIREEDRIRAHGGSGSFNHRTRTYYTDYDCSCGGCIDCAVNI